MDIKRKLSSRLGPGATGAMAHRIEASKVVLNTLEKTKTDAEIAFLKPVAEDAMAILCSMRAAAREVEIEDDFAEIGLDTCGLVFVLIHESYRIIHDGGQVPDRFRWGSDELAEYLRDDIKPFVEKKIKRGFLKRHLKHSADDEKITKTRDRLSKWLPKLGIQTDTSIREAVETIINEKVSNHDESTQTHTTGTVEPPRDNNEREQTKEIVSSPTSEFKTQGKTSARQIEEPAKRPSSVKSEENALPEIVVTASVSGNEDIKGTRKDEPADLDSAGQRDETVAPPSLVERDKEPGAKEKRKERELLAKKAERARWRRSEQEFSQLPHVSGRRKSEELSRQAASSLHSPSPPPPPPPPHVPDSASQAAAAAASTTTPSLAADHDEHKDHELAIRLQAQLAREIEEEDERKAREIGVELHRQWQAEGGGVGGGVGDGDHSGSGGPRGRRATLDSTDPATSSSSTTTSRKPERKKAFQAKPTSTMSMLISPDSSRPETPNSAVERRSID